MSNAALAEPFSAANYLRWKAEQPAKHEYISMKGSPWGARPGGMSRWC